MDTHLSSVSANARTQSGGVWADGRAARLRFVVPHSPVIAVQTAAELEFSESSAVLCFHTHVWAQGSSGHQYFSEEVTVSESWRRAASFTHKLYCARSSWMWTWLLASTGTSHQRRVNQLLTRCMVKIASDVEVKIDMRREVSQNVLVQTPQGSWTVLTVILSESFSLQHKKKIIFH